MKNIIHPLFGALCCVTLAACGTETTSVTEADSVEIESEEMENKLDELESRIEIARELIDEDDRINARLTAQRFVAKTEQQDVNRVLLDYWQSEAGGNDRVMAVMLAEEAARAFESGPSYYIAGLAYWGGITVPKLPAKAVEYWDHPTQDSNGAVQYRLYEMYSDNTSDIFDPERADRALQRSVELGYVPQ